VGWVLAPWGLAGGFTTKGTKFTKRSGNAGADAPDPEHWRFSGQVIASLSS